jgi:hypothetical protein
VKYVIKTHGSTVIKGTRGHTATKETLAKGSISTGTYLDRYKRKRSRTPYVWDAAIFSTIATAERNLAQCQAGEHGQVGDETFEIVQVVEDGYLVREI